MLASPLVPAPGLRWRDLPTEGTPLIQELFDSLDRGLVEVLQDDDGDLHFVFADELLEDLDACVEPLATALPRFPTHSHDECDIRGTERPQPKRRTRRSGRGPHP